MGKKINPKIFRLKHTRTWDSLWFADKSAYREKLAQDIMMKTYLREKLAAGMISQVSVERTAKEVNVNVFSARPGVIIGRGGAGIEDLRKDLSRKFVKNKNILVKVNIKEVRNPNLDAAIVAQGIKADLEKRIPFRRAMKQAILKVEKARALGVKVIVSGRLNGAEIAREEKLLVGKVPLHTLRADIDYALEEAKTIYGVIGVKVWIYRGDVFKEKKVPVSAVAAERN